jgi:CheY-like chemotaxis protein
MPYGKVLVVDDLAMNLDVMIGLLMPYGLKVDTALSGAEAVEMVRRGEPRYDLVFMDHMMPGMDGVEAARVIRNELDSEYARNVPMVVLTANAIAGNREMFLDHGFNDFISKPVDIKQLDVILNQWVRDKQSAETLESARGREAGRPEPGPMGEGGQDAAMAQWFLEHPVEGIDFAAAQDRYRGSGEAAFVPMLRSFVAHTPPLLDRMAVHVESSLKDYAIEVHGLKGVCNAVCAGECAALAQDLERAAKAGDLGAVQSGHGELAAKLRVLLDKLGDLLGEWDGEHPAEEKDVAAEPDRELLIRLYKAAGEYHSGAIDEALGELERYRYEKGEELVRRLRAQADSFDYDALRQGLEEFLGEEFLG